MKLIKEAYTTWGAEVVFITSNYQGNSEMMEGCKEAGIPAFVSSLRSPIYTVADSVLGYTLGLLIHPYRIFFKLHATTIPVSLL